MSQDNLIPFRKNAKSVGVKTSKESGTASAFPGFSREWKALCLNILRAYKEKLRLELGRDTLEWTAIRDLIMKDVDDRSGVREVGRSRLLTRQVLEHWDGGISTPRDDKFIFIDRFVRTLNLDGNLLEAAEDVMRSHDEFRMSVLAEIYQRGRVPESWIEPVFTQGEILVARYNVGENFRSILVRMDFIASRIIRVTCAYCPFDVTGKGYFRHRDVEFYDGVLIPSYDLQAGSQNEDDQDNPENIIALLKLYRPQFKGHPYLGSLEGRVQFGFRGPGARRRMVLPPRSAIAFLEPQGNLHKPFRDSHGLPSEAVTLEAFGNKRKKFAEIFADGYKGYLN